MSDKETLVVPKPECLWCIHLVGDLGKKEEDCRQEEWCPAGEVAIVLGTNMNAAAERLATAWKSEDESSAAKVLAEISPLHKTVKSQIWRMAKGKVAAGSV